MATEPQRFGNPTGENTTIYDVQERRYLSSDEVGELAAQLPGDDMWTYGERLRRIPAWWPARYVNLAGDAEPLVGEPPFQLFGGCAYCGRVGPLTRDHLIPRWLGGGGGDNVVLACSRCNHKKGGATPEQWYAWLDSADGQVFLGQAFAIDPRPAGAPIPLGVAIKGSRKRTHRSGYCDECGGRVPSHFTRCAARIFNDAQTRGLNGG